MKGNDTMSLTAKMLSIMMFTVTLSASAEYVWDADGGQTAFGDDVAFTFDEGGKISIMELFGVTTAISSSPVIKCFFRTMPKSQLTC